MTEDIHDSDYPDEEHEMGLVADWLALKSSNAKGHAPSIHQKGALTLYGPPGEIRTPDTQVRSLVLYPAELRAEARSLGFPLKKVKEMSEPTGRTRRISVSRHSTKYEKNYAAVLK